MQSREVLIERAREFANAQYASESDRITRESQEELAEVRAKMAVRGLAASGPMDKEVVRIKAESIRAHIQARADALLEGYELHDVKVDENLAKDILNEVLQMRTQMVAGAKAGMTSSMRVAAPYMVVELDRRAAQYGNTLKARIERRRLNPKNATSGTEVVYHISGQNARVNVNSTDLSVNVVETTSENIFSSLRQRLDTQVLDSDDKGLILARLSALEEAQNSPEFAHRFTDFIAVSANLMTIVGPFIPALSEMLKKAIAG